MVRRREAARSASSRAQAGLSGDEDRFSRPLENAKNRRRRLGVNLLTAFVASRVIGRFEGTIQQVGVLAAQMLPL
jgi:magnesium transporter